MWGSDPKNGISETPQVKADCVKLIISGWEILVIWEMQEASMSI